MSKQNTERNKIIVLTRFADPILYSYAKIGDMQNPPLTKQTVQNICLRDWTKYLTKTQLKKRPNP
jgi:hypothetical protein